MPALGQGGDRGAELAGAHGVDADRRLVQEDDGRIVEQPAGDVQALPHPAGVALDALLLAPLQADELEQLVDPGALALRLHAVELGEVAEVVDRREPLVEPAVAAEDVPDPLPDPARVLDHVVAEHARLARGRDAGG